MRAGKRWKKVDVKNSFQYVNFNCRNAEAYGQRVYDWPAENHYGSS